MGLENLGIAPTKNHEIKNGIFLFWEEQINLFGIFFINELILTFYFTQFSLFQSSSPKFKNIDKVSKNNEIHWAKHFS